MVAQVPLLLFLSLPFPTGSPQTAHAAPPSPRPWGQPWPQKQWSVQASVGRKNGEWRLGLWKTPFSAFSYTVDPASIRLVVRDHRNMPVPVTLNAAEPGSIDSDPRRQQPGEQSFRLRWNVAALKPEMYNVSATVRVRATDDATGKLITLPPVRVTGFRFYKTPEPDAAPALKPGQRFIFLPRYEPTPEDLKRAAEDTARMKAARKVSDQRLFAINALIALDLAVPDALASSQPDVPNPPRFQPEYRMPYSDAETGEPVLMRDVVLKIFTLRGVHPGADGVSILEFAVEGRKNLVRVASAGDVEHLPHLTPLVEDSTVRALRAKFEGKRVWFNGGGGFECITLIPRESGSSGTEATVPYKFKRLVRLYQRNETLAIGGAPGYMGPRDSEFTFDNPILAVVDIPPKAVLNGLAWGGLALGDAEKNMPYLARDLQKLCAGTVMYFADAWDMERECRLQNPSSVALNWPARFRTAVSKGELRKGMTPDMVVAVMGWPNEFATPDEMRKWPAWRYDSTPPYNYWVNFNHGRVSGWGPDGQLP